jgi:hypothetical protein
MYILRAFKVYLIVIKRFFKVGITSIALLGLTAPRLLLSLPYNNNSKYSGKVSSYNLIVSVLIYFKKMLEN